MNDAKGSPVKAIGIGILVDIIGSLIVGVIITIIYAIILANTGVSTEEIKNRLANVDPYSIFSMIGTTLGCFVSLFAGYLCAKTVNYSEYKFVAIMGLISATLGVAISGPYYSITENIILIILTFASVLLGARVHVNDKAKNKQGFPENR